MWHTARKRVFLITTGLKNNRWLRVPDETEASGWQWQKLSEYVAGLSTQDYVQMVWPLTGKLVYVHIVNTRVRKLYC